MSAYILLWVYDGLGRCPQTEAMGKNDIKHFGKALHAMSEVAADRARKIHREGVETILGGS